MLMNIELYLKENIDDHVTIKSWLYDNRLPIYLRNFYHFYEMTILDKPRILIEILKETPRLDIIQKHIKRIEEITSQQTVLYFKDITRYRRKSLIENRIPFIIENGQVYLPFLGLDLKRAPQYAREEVVTFSTSAQMAYLFFLYNKDTEINATVFAEKMGFAVMTASRALNELYYAKLITYETGGKTGRSKKYRRISDPEYFEKGRAHIKSPVKKVVYVQRSPKGALIAGLDALAELSMLNPPGRPIRAVSQKLFIKEEVEIIRNKDIVKDQKLVELEIWNYDPKQFAKNENVDIMSLYASLKGEIDERIEQALEQVLRGETFIS